LQLFDVSEGRAVARSESMTTISVRESGLWLAVFMAQMAVVKVATAGSDSGADGCALTAARECADQGAARRAAADDHRCPSAAMVAAPVISPVATPAICHVDVLDVRIGGHDGGLELNLLCGRGLG
jgi:hypothetical protein